MEILKTFLASFTEKVKAIAESDDDDYGKLLALRGYIFGVPAVGYNGTKACFSMLEKGYDPEGYRSDIENAVKREIREQDKHFALKACKQGKNNI